MADKPDTLAAAMAKAFAAIEGATKSANNPHFKSKYADLTSVIEAIKPALVANGLFFTQSPRPNEKGVEIETTLHHAGGEVFSLGSLFVPADRNNAQAFGSALTYARRYALVTAFGVPVEDDDGNAAAQASPAKATGRMKDTAPTNPTIISEDDRLTLVAYMDKSPLPMDALLSRARIKDLRELPAGKLKGAWDWIKEQEELLKKASAAQVIDDEIAY